MNHLFCGNTKLCVSSHDLFRSDRKERNLNNILYSFCNDNFFLMCMYLQGRNLIVFSKMCKNKTGKLVLSSQWNRHCRSNSVQDNLFTSVVIECRSVSARHAQNIDYGVKYGVTIDLICNIFALRLIILKRRVECQFRMCMVFRPLYNSSLQPERKINTLTCEYSPCRFSRTA